jgi:hypothetical protein
LKAEAITPEQFSALKSVFEKEGWKSFWKAQLEFAKKEPQHFGGTYELAQIHARIGETDGTFQLLEKAYIEKDPNLQNLRFDPLFDNVHSDPRFDDLLRRMKLI